MVSLRFARAVAVCAAVLLVVGGAGASTITFPMSVEFSGGTPPIGASPWLTATFDDGGSAGSVDLTLETTNLTGTEFVFQWTFNLDPALDPTDLEFSAPTKIGAFANPTVSLGTNAFMADGDGRYDVKVAFENSDGPPTRFGAGDTVIYTITGIPTLTASSFDFLSEPAGGHGPYPTAAHVGAIPPDGNSGWITTPEPAALSLVALGAGLLLGRRRR